MEDMAAWNKTLIPNLPGFFKLNKEAKNKETKE